MVYSAEQGASQYIDKINAETFTDIALELFRYQYAQNVVYRSFVDALKVSVPVWKREEWEGGTGWGTNAADLVAPSDVPHTAGARGD